jgi:predicted O-linked N-acetylglucosamine transferase (SPINDLY family)
MPTLSEALTIATAHHRAGRLDLAEEIYRRILAADPNHADALHLVGLVRHHRGRSAEAIPWMLRALELNPGEPDYHNNLADAYRAVGRIGDATRSFRRAVELGPQFAPYRVNLAHALLAQGQLDEAIAEYRHALQQNAEHVEAQRGLAGALRVAGRLEEAEAGCRRALELRPDDARLHNDLGVVLRTQGRLREAVDCYRQAIAFDPRSADAFSNLGGAWQDLGDLDQAVACCRRAIELRPEFAEAHNNLANALQRQGQLALAVDGYRRALELRPDFVEAWSNLGNALQELGRYAEAEACYRRALALRPDHAKSYNDLGIALRRKGEFDEELACYRRALELQPDMPEVYNNQGTAMKELGRLDEALASYRQALKRSPSWAIVHSNLLFTLQYREGVTRKELAAAHADFERLHAAPLRSTWKPHANLRDPQRPLRVGFVSFDLARHPVGYFLTRLVQNLDPPQVQVACYSLRPVGDDFTARFQATSAVWREAYALSDERLAEQIRDDRIDILFDLGGHTAQNRLLVFARKPAPIQITWAGYVGTTGLSAMDYLLADRYHVPPEAEPDYVERVLRMPHDYVTFAPPAYAPPVGPLPALSRGHVTFGSFSTLPKLAGPGPVELWAEILDRVPDSRLVIHAGALKNATVRAGLAERFAQRSIAADRVEYVGPLPHDQLLACYQRVDVALDSFPYTGGLTTLEALWMGVPVITWPGETFAGRHAFSHLSNVGLTETIADTRAEYVEIAARLAADLPHLAHIRAGLRSEVARSPLCDGRQFAADWLELMRRVWREWCQA